MRISRLGRKDLFAKARRKLGLSRQLEQARSIGPDPSNGGTTGYPVWYRIDQLDRFYRNEAIDVSLASIYRWEVRLNPFRPTGNHASATIVGTEVLLLSLFIVAHPDATLNEMAAFLYNEGCRLYSESSVSKRLSDLKVTKKKASTEAYQAQREDVQFRVHCFWNCGLPLGVRDSPRRKLVDFDEFGLTLEK